MSRYARTERAALADTLTEVGPDAPTLCEGWASRDLAAHLVLRERRPIAALGIGIRPLAGLTRHAQRRLATGGYPDLVAAVREGPRWSPTRLGAIDEAVNLAEFFIHHEDVRRARPEWRPRPLPEEYATALWRRVSMLARLRLARNRSSVTVVAAGYGRLAVGRGRSTATLSGAPGELLLFLSGRRPVADVTLDGPGAWLD